MSTTTLYARLFVAALGRRVRRGGLRGVILAGAALSGAGWVPVVATAQTPDDAAGGTAQAAQSGSGEAATGVAGAGGTDGVAAQEDVPVVTYLDLGDFHVREFHPTLNETVNVRFTLQLELPPKTSDRQLEALSHWRHRLRDQVIIAVRLCSSSDFAEPHLVLVQRTILRRINRILAGLRIDALYLTDFVAAEI